jgi:hypothetical protein
MQKYKTITIDNKIYTLEELKNFGKLSYAGDGNLLLKTSNCEYIVSKLYHKVAGDYEHNNIYQVHQII